MNLNNRKALLIVFGIASAIVLLSATQRYMVSLTGGTQWTGSKFATFPADAALWYFSAFAVFPIYRIASHFPVERVSRIRLIGIHIFFGVLFAFANICVQSLVLWMVYHDSIGVLIQTSFIQKMFMRTAFYFLIVIACYAYIAFQRHREEELRVQRLEARLALAQLQALKSRLNPSFVLETLRSIGNLISKDIESADLLTARLGDFLRLSLDHGHDTKVTLQQELQLVRSYLDVQSVTNPDLKVQIGMDRFAASAPVSNRSILEKVESLYPFRSIQIHGSLNGDTLNVMIAGPASLTLKEQCDVEVPSAEMEIADESSAPLGLEEFQLRIKNQQQKLERLRPTFWKSFGRTMAIWTVVALFFLTRELVIRLSTATSLELLNNIKDYAAWYWWAIFTPLIFWLAKKFPITAGKSVPRIFLHLLLSLCISIVMVFLYAGQRWVLGMDPMLRELLLEYSYPLDMLTYLAIVAVYQGITYHRKYLQDELRTARLKGNLVEAQLQALKMQLHPHFLFNSLNSISELMHEDTASARLMLKRLESFLKLTFQNSEVQEITLQSELEFLQNYLQIQQIRFQGRLTVAMKIDPNAIKDRVPNLILQPIVENAIRHGIAARNCPGKVEIRASHENGRLVLQVQDDGPGMPMTDFREGLGIYNTRMRLEQLYGKFSTFRMSNDPTGGLLVTLKIPVHSEQATA
jgi:two-component system, LytTR family, sensor kinase